MTEAEKAEKIKSLKQKYNKETDAQKAKKEELKQKYNSNWPISIREKGLTIEEIQERKSDIVEYYRLGLTNEFMKDTEDIFYEIWFGDIPSVVNPLIWYNTGTICSGKTVFGEQWEGKEQLFGGVKFGKCNKDEIKAVFPLRDEIMTLYPALVSEITDHILSVRSRINSRAIKDKKNICSEQSLKSDFSKNAEEAKAAGYTVAITNLCVSDFLIYARELFRFAKASVKDLAYKTHDARQEPKENLDETIKRAKTNLAVAVQHTDKLYIFDSRYSLIGEIDRAKKGTKSFIEIMEEQESKSITGVDLYEIVSRTIWVQDMIKNNEIRGDKADFKKLFREVKKRIKSAKGETILDKKRDTERLIRICSEIISGDSHDIQELREIYQGGR